ncbi:hypothetical protein [Ekhidna sp.]
MSPVTKYGHAIVPKGTFLVRLGNGFDYRDCIFFSLNTIAIHSQGNNPTPQVWKVVSDIDLVFMVSYIDRRARAISSIVEIYQNSYPLETEIDDLDIKQRDFRKREKLVQTLQENQIIGWLSSFENNQHLEICLFPDHNDLKSMVKPMESRSVSEFDNYNALNYIEVFPSKQFFLKSKEICGDNTFDSYSTWYDGLIREQIELYGLDKETAYKKELNLRMKLKI